VITTIVQVVPSVAGQRIIVTFPTNENLKPAEILRGLRKHFGDETLSRIQVCEWSKSFKEGGTKTKNIRRLHLLQGKL
jgi:hypothetical protein